MCSIRADSQTSYYTKRCSSSAQGNGIRGESVFLLSYNIPKSGLIPFLHSSVRVKSEIKFKNTKLMEGVNEVNHDIMINFLIMTDGLYTSHHNKNNHE